MIVGENEQWADHCNPTNPNVVCHRWGLFINLIVADFCSTSKWPIALLFVCLPPNAVRVQSSEAIPAFTPFLTIADDCSSLRIAITLISEYFRKAVRTQQTHPAHFLVLFVPLLIFRLFVGTMIKTASKCKPSRHQSTRGSSVFIRGVGTSISPWERNSMDAEWVSWAGIILW